MRVEIYLDAISPYSFLALTFLARYQDIWDIDIHIHTVSLPNVIRKAGNIPPGFIASKAAMNNADVIRNAKLFDLPIQGIPTNHPAIPHPKGTELI
jgi:2-hydroxychromene-2-carboxylate isomerase